MIQWDRFTDKLKDLVGRELPMDEVNRTLSQAVQDQRPGAVGALHVTCADESEREAMESFQQCLVQWCLPRLKLAHQAPFRLANLGARYEWGAVRIAETHYAAALAGSGFLLMVLKVGAHTSVDKVGHEIQYGKLLRYRADSDYCGALHATLAGDERPFAQELGNAFGCEGLDRLTLLRDRKKIPARLRMLYAALASARLQARRAMLDIQDHQPAFPTAYVVLPSVTVNRPGRDTEIPVGFYTADHTGSKREEHYLGLGDNPVQYRVEHDAHGRARVSDDQHQTRRVARNHRHIIRDHARSRPDPIVPDERLTALVKQIEQQKHQDHSYAKASARTLLGLLAELNPVTSVLLLFANGYADMHHAHQVHRLAHGLDGDTQARALMSDIIRRVEQLPAERARHLLDALSAHLPRK